MRAIGAQHLKMPINQKKSQILRIIGKTSRKKHRSLTGKMHYLDMEFSLILLLAKFED